jgi:hypothetical protein
VVGFQITGLAFFHSDEDPKHPTEMSAPPPQQIVQPVASAAQAPVQQGPLPSPATLVQAAKLAMAQDNPIRLDYYAESCNGKAFMGEDGETKEKMLVKSSEEFTSMIQKTYKVAEDYIVLTENSIYIVNGKLQKRRIQANTLRND